MKLRYFKGLCIWKLQWITHLHSNGTYHSKLLTTHCKSPFANTHNNFQAFHLNYGFILQILFKKHLVSLLWRCKQTLWFANFMETSLIIILSLKIWKCILSQLLELYPYKNPTNKDFFEKWNRKIVHVECIINPEWDKTQCTRNSGVRLEGFKKLSNFLK